MGKWGKWFPGKWIPGNKQGIEFLNSKILIKLKDLR
jgi:hypothetical protein